MSRNCETVSPSKRTVWAPVVLFAFALFLAMDPLPFTTPLPATVPAPDWATDTTPVRVPKPRPEYDVAVFTYRCSDCHKIIPSPGETDRGLTQHREIELRHGVNTRCFNCHHPTNRDAFVDDSGDEIPWGEPQLLCAKCHGPVYRDWQHGSHGRTNGYWDTNKGQQTRRKCIECHDPHHPPFPAMVPAPGPRTLRLGKQDHGAHEPRRNPLRLNEHAGRGA